MARDIDYAAIACKTAIVEKFGRQTELQDLNVVANERTISIIHGDREAEGTRDDILAAVARPTPTKACGPDCPSTDAALAATKLPLPFNRWQSLRADFKITPALAESAAHGFFAGVCGPSRYHGRFRCGSV